MYRRPYVESSVFVAFIKGEMRGEHHDCKAILESILDAASGGDFAIYTSSLTIAEVFKNKRDGVQLTPQENEDLTPYFREGYIRLIEVDRGIAERANELCRTHVAGNGVPALRPNDAIHLASAERADCEVLLAYDKDLTKQTHSSIRIEWPRAASLEVPKSQMLLAPGEPPIQENLPLGEFEDEAPLAIAASPPESTINGTPTETEQDVTTDRGVFGDENTP